MKPPELQVCERETESVCVLTYVIHTSHTDVTTLWEHVQRFNRVIYIEGNVITICCQQEDKKRKKEHCTFSPFVKNKGMRTHSVFGQLLTQKICLLAVFGIATIIKSII